MQTPNQRSQISVNVDDILLNSEFHPYYGLEQALKFAGEEGYVATIPELMAAKIKADRNHRVWSSIMGQSAHTEEDMGVDKKGRIYSRGTRVLVFVNGGGILTPERIRQAYKEHSVSAGIYSYQEKEFDDLLKGILPDGSQINLYEIEDIKRGVSELPHRFGIVMPFYYLRESFCSLKEDFLTTTFFLGLSANLEVLNNYYERVKEVRGQTNFYYSCAFYEHEKFIFKGRGLSLSPGFNPFYETTHNQFPYIAVAAGEKKMEKIR